MHKLLPVLLALISATAFAQDTGGVRITRTTPSYPNLLGTHDCSRWVMVNRKRTWVKATCPNEFVGHPDPRRVAGAADIRKFVVPGSGCTDWTRPHCEASRPQTMSRAPTSSAR